MKMSSALKLLCVAMCVGLAFFLCGCGKGCSGCGGKTPAESPAPPKPPQPPGGKIQGVSLAGEKLTELNNTEWQITITSQTDKGKGLKSDILRFVDKKVYSVTFKSQGYERSNYTLRPKSDGRVTWETMQTKKGEGIIFWRGDWQNDKMRGVISKVPENGKKEALSFVSTDVRRIEKDLSGREKKK